MSVSESQPVAFELVGVQKRFGKRRALTDLDLVVRRGERVALIGPSGSGKTTLLRLLTGVLWPEEGRVLSLGQDTRLLSGRELRAFRRRIGFLYQSDNLVPNLRVVHNVLMGRLGTWSLPRALLSLLVPRELDAVKKALREVELEERLWDLPGTLSGGQQQRVAIARLLLQRPEILLADEPVSSLDIRLGREVLQTLIQTVVREDATLIVSLHTLDLLRGHFERVIALQEGKKFWEGRPEDLSRDLLQDLYGTEYRALHLDELELGCEL